MAMKSDIVRFLAQDKDDDAFFTTMIDLYGIHPEFPGLDESEKLRRQIPYVRSMPDEHDLRQPRLADEERDIFGIAASSAFNRSARP